MDVDVLLGFLWLIWFLGETSEFLALFVCEDRVYRRELERTV